MGMNIETRKGAYVLHLLGFIQGSGMEAVLEPGIAKGMVIILDFTAATQYPRDVFETYVPKLQRRCENIGAKLILCGLGKTGTMAMEAAGFSKKDFTIASTVLQAVGIAAKWLKENGKEKP
jgi:hypothetical protein